MQFDNSLILAITFNIVLILTVSWLGIKIINNNLTSRVENRNITSQVTKAVRDTSIIIPRFKASLRIKRMIKTSSDSDDTPYFKPQLI